MGNSENASDSGTGITLQDLRSFDFERILSQQGDDPDNVEGRTCDNYNEHFVDERNLAVSEGDPKKEAICDVFAILTLWRCYFNDNIVKPFPPPDIDKDHLELLKQFANEIKDPEFKARIADILWYLRVDKGFQFAELAVAAYLDAATRFDRVKASHDRAIRIERALQIAAALGTTRQTYASTIAFIETELKEMKEADILSGPAHLLRLLGEQRQGDPEVYIPYATHLTKEFEKKNDWEGTRAVWWITRDWHRLAEDGEAARCAERQAAMTYEPEAIDWMKQGTHTHFKVISLLEKGLVALRDSGAPKDDVNRVHALLLETQANYDGHKTVSFSIDISEPVESIKREFREQTLRDCIYRLAAKIGPPPVDWLKAQANELRAKHQLQHHFTKRLVDKQGKVIGQRPGYTHNDINSLEESIRFTMYEEAKNWQQLTAASAIKPAQSSLRLNKSIWIITLTLTILSKSLPTVPLFRPIDNIFSCGAYITASFSTSWSHPACLFLKLKTQYGMCSSNIR